MEDRGAWHATAIEWQRVGHGLVTEQQHKSLITSDTEHCSTLLHIFVKNFLHFSLFFPVITSFNSEDKVFIICVRFYNK